MSGHTPAPDSAEPRDRYPGTPGWVKAIGIVLLVLVLLAAFIVATGLGGPHGPQRHGARSIDAGELIATTPAV
jgi:HAMP domain-containing protein